MKCGACKGEMRPTTSMKRHCSPCGVTCWMLPAATRTDLTEKQAAVLAFIVEKKKEQGYPPSRREIAKRFAITVNAVAHSLRYIEKKGYIEIGYASSRGIRVVSR